MRVSSVQDTETAGGVAGQKGSATDTSLSRVMHAAVPTSGGRRLNIPERRCVSTGGSTVSVAEPFCPTTGRRLLALWVGKGVGLYGGAGAESGFR